MVILCGLFSLPLYGQQPIPGTWEAQSDENAIVVPQGTRIQTDILQHSPDTHEPPYEYKGKVVIPVRLGFYEAIPAGSTVTVLVNRRYYDTGIQDVAELVNVVVNNKTYDIRTDQQTIQPATVKEVAFTLLTPVKISR